MLLRILHFLNEYSFELDHGDPSFMMLFQFRFFLVFGGLAHITGETLPVFSLRLTPTLPKGTGVTILWYQSPGFIDSVDIPFFNSYSMSFSG